MFLAIQPGPRWHGNVRHGEWQSFQLQIININHELMQEKGYWFCFQEWSTLSWVQARISNMTNSDEIHVPILQLNSLALFDFVLLHVNQHCLHGENIHILTSNGMCKVSISGNVMGNQLEDTSTIYHRTRLVNWTITPPQLCAGDRSKQGPLTLQN